MVLPIFNPRLEAIRALMQAIRGNDAATLATVIELLTGSNGWAEIDYAQQLQHSADLALLARSTGAEGLPPAGAPWANVYYGLLNQIIANQQIAGANQPGADEAVTLYAPRLAAIDSKLEALITSVEGALYNQIDGTPIYAYGSAILGRLETDLEAIRSRLFTMENALLEIQACICEEPPPALDFEYPSGVCTEFPRRYRFSGLVDVQGVPGSGSPVVYAFTNIEASGTPFPDFIGGTSNSLGISWITNDLASDRQACYVTSTGAITFGLRFDLRRSLQEGTPSDINTFTANVTEMTGIDPDLSQTFTMLAGQDEPTVQRYYYTPTVTDLTGRDLALSGAFSVWLCVGGVG